LKEVSVRRLLLLALIAQVTGSQLADAQRGESTPTRADARPIFRLSVSLVQLDAVVTDGKGRHVTTLEAQDFEVFQDGRPQPVTAVAYVDASVDWQDTSGFPPLPAEAIRPTDARRVIGIVVDDLRMSFESIFYARHGLDRFAQQQFVPGDRVVLVTTSGGYGRAPELTASAGTLKAAVNRLRYSMWGMSGASALDPLDGANDSFGALEAFRDRSFAVGAIQRVEDVIDALKPLPGRKSVVLVSEGFAVGGVGIDSNFIQSAMQGLVDRANRAGVVIYAIDPRGLVVTGLTAADSSSGMSAARLSGVASMRAQALRESQDGLRFLAGETGGFAVVNSNDLAFGMKRIMTDQRGYYLIGYQPEAGTLAEATRPRFRHLKIKVKRKGLRVRTRSGFYNVASE
jgi:VWFA-related protein